MFPRVLHGAVLLIVATLVGATPASAIESAPEIAGLIERYAEEHLPRGEILVGVDVNGSSRWYSTGDLRPDTRFEIGSVTKTLTGMLLSANIASGRVTARTTVEELWPTGPRAAEGEIPAVSGPLADVTLEQLATHTSGLPRLNLDPIRLLRTVVRQDDPYAGLSAADVFRDAASASLGESGTFQYSNLGYALLGALLVEDPLLSASYPEAYLDAVHTHVMAPLELPRVSGSSAAGALPTAYTVNGRRADPWTFEGYFAAGGVIAPAADVLRYARKIHDLPLELATAIEPQAAAGDDRRVGYGWLLEEIESGETLIWHNGGTGGFRTFVAAVPERGLSVAVFGTSAVSVDSLGRAIILGRDRAEAPETTTALQWAIGSALLLWLGWFVVSRLVRTRPTDLLTVTQGVVEALFVTSVWARSAPPPLYVPGIELLLVAAAIAVGGLQAVRLVRAGESTRFAGGRSTLRTVAAGAQIIIFGALAAVLW
jgi:CubicO group peptidase (beta-lactamase class C family)